MALRQKSSFLYNLQITSANSSLDFKTSALGAEKNATLNTGTYSLQDLGAEVVRALQAADPINTYSYSINRNLVGGTQNRLTISTVTGTFLSLLFGTGSRIVTSVGPTLGFAATDQTGLLSYQGTSSCGTILLPTFVGYTYLSPTYIQKMIGNSNISAAGFKETIYFATHKFFQVEFKYEPEIKVTNEWAPFMQWAAKGRPLEFCPDITVPNTVFNCTLEKTSYDGKGLGYQFREMLPDFPFLYTSGQMIYRIIPPTVSYA
ncbi:hypothetical protein EBZ39_08080 [bacterium]|nr:hypothetical protein [bacterium]